MKCVIDGIEVNAKVTENLGWQGGMYVKAVEYRKIERIVIKDGLIWRTRESNESVKPLHKYIDSLKG